MIQVVEERAKRYEYNPEYMLGLAIFLEKMKQTIQFLTV